MGRRGFVATIALMCAGALCAVVGVSSPTLAAWSDRVTVSAPVSAGIWGQASEADTCTAYGYDGAPLAECSVAEVSVETWGTPGSRERNYYITFDAPDGARSVSFDVSLAEQDDPDAEPWPWETSGVRLGAQFRVDETWTCDALPRVHAHGSDWQYPTIFFQVVENRTGISTLCP
ncbi:hypothetical protein GCM10010910_29360 [Microbacterium nanhaiense]|uniref:Secreted protein n=1 Tax=Microbacterium nanhaiense TaxID=1301026 RepID=A0ABQ2N3U6_9MICO|nr:SipW-dependent-type signal peptide-containing protein [Microbacterium nanhaiense]GGO67483.1 hypothetical protein GCM10010910_29360 [Microbacterium nanhaiense]